MISSSLVVVLGGKPVSLIGLFNQQTKLGFFSANISVFPGNPNTAVKKTLIFAEKKLVLSA